MRRMSRRKLLRRGAQAVLAGGVALLELDASGVFEIGPSSCGLLPEARRDSVHQCGRDLYGTFGFHDA